MIRDIYIPYLIGDKFIFVDWKGTENLYISQLYIKFYKDREPEFSFAFRSEKDNKVFFSNGKTIVPLEEIGKDICCIPSEEYYGRTTTIYTDDFDFDDEVITPVNGDKHHPGFFCGNVFVIDSFTFSEYLDNDDRIEYFEDNYRIKNYINANCSSIENFKFDGFNMTTKIKSFFGISERLFRLDKVSEIDWENFAVKLSKLYKAEKENLLSNRLGHTTVWVELYKYLNKENVLINAWNDVMNIKSSSFNKNNKSKIVDFVNNLNEDEKNFMLNLLKERNERM